MRKILLYLSVAVLLTTVTAFASHLSNTIATGKRVIITATTSVRDNPDGATLGTAPSHSRGTVVTVRGNMVQVDFDRAATPDGWVSASDITTLIMGRAFARHNTYYEKIPSDPIIDPHSADYINDFKKSVFGQAGADYTEDGTTIWYAREDTQTVTVSVAHPMPQHLGWNKVPIPLEARPSGYGATVYRDNNMVVISYDKRYAWEFYQAERLSDTQWRAATVRRYDLHEDGMQLDQLGSASSCNSMLSGPLLYEELRRGHIDHALTFTFRIPLVNQLQDEPKRPTWRPFPCAQMAAGSSTFAQRSTNFILNFGQRVQLDPSIDIDSLGLDKSGKVIARALQEYGAVLREGSSETKLLQENLRFHPDNFSSFTSKTMNKLPLDKFRVVESPKPPYPGHEHEFNPVVVRAKRETRAVSQPWKSTQSDNVVTIGETGFIASPDSPITLGGVEWWFVQRDKTNKSGYNNLEFNGTGGRWMKASDLEIINDGGNGGSERPPPPQSLTVIK